MKSGSAAGKTTTQTLDVLKDPNETATALDISASTELLKKVQADMNTSAEMLLTVHDELVFEAPDDEVEATLPVVAKVMVEAPEPAAKLHAPLRVDAHAAQNWEEAH